MTKAGETYRASAFCRMIFYLVWLAKRSTLATVVKQIPPRVCHLRAKIREKNRQWCESSLFWRMGRNMADWLAKRSDDGWLSPCQLFWIPVVEKFCLFLVMILPVLNSRWIFIPAFSLLAWLNIGNDKHMLVRARGVGNALFLCWLVISLSALFAPVSASKWSGWVLISLWLLLPWLLFVGARPDFLKKILRFWVWGSLGWMGIGFWQLMAGAPTPPGWLEMGQSLVIPVRIYSVFGNPNLYAIYLVSILIFALKTEGDTPFERIGIKSIALLALVSLYFTYSRTGWIIAAGYLFFHFRRSRASTQWLFAISVPALVLLPGFWIRLSGLFFGGEHTLGSRFRIWEGVWAAIRDFWLWGSGPGSFGTVYPYYQWGRTLSEHAHQWFLQVWLEYGFLSLLALLWFFWMLLRGDGCLPGVRAVIVAFLIAGLTETWSADSFSGWYFWLLCGICPGGQTLFYQQRHFPILSEQEG